ncbi:hypothetical protein [Aquimarina sp. AU474]|uniref:hypothetical protein n=1 Tax=Aquimarina sp. AU474 TaxID=2108529 RepID=UPI000D68D5B5|nr:hypothetical protein [Aquimarina sp. AU474]
MAQDIRELLKQDKQLPSERINEGHQLRFMAKLEKELPEKTKVRKFTYGWLKIAASVAIVFSISLTAYNQFQGNVSNDNEVVTTDGTDAKNSTIVLSKQSSSLAEMSPEYEKVENYLLTSIKFQLSEITVDDKNRELVDSFKLRLNNLDREYQNLSKELIEVGPNMESIEAMMENLKLRLSLLERLKDKLKELEKIENEGYDEIQA